MRFDKAVEAALKRGWCSENPVARVETPRVVEKTVPILTPEEAEQLVQAAREYKGGICLPAVGLMLYAGIRPHEVARLTLADVDLPGKRVNIAPQHSKTGGARPVTLLRPALHLLRAGGHRPAPQRICPPQWLYHWRAVRQQAGWNRLPRPCPQDVCRHSYASYHAARFRNLQWQPERLRNSITAAKTAISPARMSRFHPAHAGFHSARMGRISLLILNSEIALTGSEIHSCCHERNYPLCG